ncbi:MAG: HAMP domain-containing sensor histidine kinase, partial [Halioglobus sp.]|nr:HAMP domain-containing sensor histidine kinase [Halioglobus sp.]
LAIWFTVDTLRQLSDKSLQIAQTVVDATRLGQEIQRDVLELERRARQYLALSDFELAELFERERDILSEKLAALQASIPSPSPDIKGLKGSLGKLALPLAPDDIAADAADAIANQADRLDHEFSVINDQSKAVKTWLLASVDQLLEANAREAESLIDNLRIELSLLAAATLALLLFLAYWINKPVRDLTKEIHQLGTSGLSHPIEISGPVELQALGSELEWLRQGLHESELQKEQFLRHISHELKTPLSSLREGADLLADQVTGHLSQQQLEIVDIVRQNGIELQRLIENLIDYNRLPSQDLNFEKFELESLWQEILSSYSLTMDKKSLWLAMEGDVDTWTADRDKLRTSLDNLISNAVNYTPNGGSIDIAWRSEDATLVIDVANSGDPIPAEDAERVFEPFFQSAAKRSGPIKGSGIGLSVARECIEAQGGKLSLARHGYLPVCFRLVCPAH